MRTEWTDQDRLIAGQLAGIRSKLDRERTKASRASATVSTAAGGEKPNPLFAVIDKLATQERQLTRRLSLGSKRNASGRYEANCSPVERRKQLWDIHAANCRANLLPGLWLFVARSEGVAIPEDEAYEVSNPTALPVTTS